VHESGFSVSRETPTFGALPSKIVFTLMRGAEAFRETGDRRTVSRETGPGGVVSRPAMLPMLSVRFRIGGAHPRDRGGRGSPFARRPGASHPAASHPVLGRANDQAVGWPRPLCGPCVRTSRKGDRTGTNEARRDASRRLGEKIGTAQIAGALRVSSATLRICEGRTVQPGPARPEPCRTSRPRTQPRAGRTGHQPSKMAGGTRFATPFPVRRFSLWAVHRLAPQKPPRARRSTPAGVGSENRGNGKV
jgi:hypothetical protein